MSDQEIYMTISKLLEDICSFLDESKLTALSPNDRKFANDLLKRSKVQLQEISKKTDYVDMDPAKENKTYKPANKNVYVPPPDNTPVEPEDFYNVIEVNDPDACPFLSMPAKDTSFQSKHGYISYKKKVFVRFEKLKRIFAVIQDQWFLIYNTEKDLKPTSHLNLKEYAAKECAKNKFELISTKGETKIYYFIALTYKDMLQWVTKINECHDSSMRKKVDDDDDDDNTYIKVGQKLPPSKIPQYKPYKSQNLPERYTHQVLPPIPPSSTFKPDGTPGKAKKILPPKPPARNDSIKPPVLPKLPTKQLDIDKEVCNNDDDESDESDNKYHQIVPRNPPPESEDESSFSEADGDDITYEMIMPSINHSLPNRFAFNDN
ncbi:unnamed protein product [Brassicogethes aeneus]|uniref:PH domain-containing protein n=1 Tax=Brassicogethes aeneus TaxID=1431903 RepID=A0A9P0FPG1_BRAAE|nr:unnamed protein product [Brassicogethes aeneus]